jgi:hypothetical protein
MSRSGSTVLAPLFFVLPALLIAQATHPESVRPPDSHKVALAVTGLLGWRLGARPAGFKDATFFDAAVKTDAAGLGAIEAFSSQKVSADIAKNFDSSLSAPEQGAIRKKLKALSLNLAAYHVDKLGPGDGNVLEFAKSLGAGMVIASVPTDAMAAVDKMAGEAGINVAIESKDPKSVAAALQQASPRMGIATGAKDVPTGRLADYGSVWIKSYGKGRVFNCAMGHTPTLFATPDLAQLILNGIQFILGDLPADTTPSAKLSAKR